MDLSKFSDADLDALEKGDIRALSDAGLDELERQQAPVSVAEQNLRDLDGKGPLDELAGAAKAGMHVLGRAGDKTKAGYAGVADLIAGNGLDTSVSNIKRVDDGKDATTQAANIGAALGSEFTPGAIAAQATFGKLAEMVGPALGNMLKGWGEKAARNAVGMIASIAKTLNVELPDLAQFLMKPVTIGGKTFAPIVRATSDVGDMLKDAEAIQTAAGKQLAAIAAKMDDAIIGAITWAEENAEPQEVILNLKAMKPAVEELKEKAVGGLEDVAPDVVQKFDGILKALQTYTGKQENGTMATAFSDLSSMKTKLGGLTNFKSQTENNLAMQQAYGVMAQTLKEAADKVGGDIAEEYENANRVYHQVTAVVSALTGKDLKFQVKDIFAPGAGAFFGTLIGGLPGLALGATAGALGKTYGYQAIARGLNAVAPAVPAAVQTGLRSLPVVGDAIYQGLRSKNEE